MIIVILETVNAVCIISCLVWF